MFTRRLWSLVLLVAFLGATPSTRVHAARPALEMKTPLGTARLLRTPDGRERHVVIDKSLQWGGGRTRNKSEWQYKIVSGKGEALEYEQVQPIHTQFGSTTIVERDGRLVQQLTIHGHRFEVTENARREHTYTSPGGTVSKGLPREGEALVMQEGLTRSLLTPSGRKDVIVLRRPAWSRNSYVQRGYYAVVKTDSGYPTYEEIQPIGTAYGTTRVIELDGRLIQQLRVGKQTYRVRQSESGLIEFSDESGAVSRHVIRSESGILTPEGMTRSLETVDGPRDVLVKPSQSTPRAKEFHRVQIKGGELVYTEIVPVDTQYGRATLSEVKGRLENHILIDGKRYSVKGRGRAMTFLDGQGKPYVDTWGERIASAEPLPSAVRRPYVKEGLRALGNGDLVTINDRGTAYSFMAKQAYGEIRDAMIETLSKYDPRTHYFIGLGSDPHPIIAFLENLGGRGLAVNFPASGKYHSGVPGATLAPYVRKLIPPEILAGQRTLVFLDQTNSGQGRAGTLAQVVPSFRAYLSSIGSPAKVTSLAFSPTAQPRGTGRIDTSKYPEVGKFLYAPYEHTIAEYDRHVLGQNTLKQLIPRPEYQKFRRAMLERMKRDAVLDRFLAKTLKDAPAPDAEEAE